MDTINGYVDNWMKNYHSSAKLLSLQVGNLNEQQTDGISERSMGAPNFKLEMRTWDAMETVYPYFNNLKQYQHVSFETRSNAAILIQDNSVPGI